MPWHAFREGNLKLAEAAQRHGYSGIIPFICECSDTTCLARVELDAAAFDAIRRSGRYVLAVGHDCPDRGR